VFPPVFLQRQKQNFSEVFYQRHRQHVLRLVRKSSLYFAISGAFAALFVVACLAGKGTLLEAVIAAAVFLWICFGISFGLPDSLRARLLPYFEKPLGDIETWPHGKSLLEHSRQLDELASALSATPLSKFASGDDLIPGETLTWFDAQPALETTEKLLQADAARAFSPELTSDLSHLRDALQSASAKQTRFCLLLREGSATSDAEMKRRKGSFF
jgi:hypothetical protein